MSPTDSISWLSFTLGYAASVSAEDITCCTKPNTLDPSVNELIHCQALQVVLIAAEISTNLSIGGRTNYMTINYLGDKLDAWHAELPRGLQLSTLVSNDSSLNLYQKRAILMVHVLYLGAITLLYREPLILAEKSRQVFGTEGIHMGEGSGIPQYQSRCSMAAQQIARIFGLISFDGVMTFRCWLTIYWSYTASTILLFMAAQKMLDRVHDNIDQDIEYAGDLLEKLTACRTEEPMAEKFWRLVQPLHERLGTLRSDSLAEARAQNSANTFLDSDPDVDTDEVVGASLHRDVFNEVATIADRLADLLKDPFGRMQQAMEGVDPVDGVEDVGHGASASVFWWK